MGKVTLAWGVEAGWLGGAAVRCAETEETARIATRALADSKQYLVMISCPRASNEIEALRGVQRSRRASRELRVCNRCGCRVLAVEVAYKSACDIDAIRCIDHRNLAAVDNYGDATSFCKNLKSLTNVFLQRSEDLLTASVVSSLGIFTFALVILFQLIELLGLLLKSFWISNGLRVRNLFRQCSYARLYPIQLRFPGLKFPIHRA